MGMEMKLNLKMSQKLVMTPMLQQAIKLLPLARMELAQLVRQEIIDNPILEEILQEDSEDEFDQENEEIEQDFKEETLAEVGQEILPESLDTSSDDNYNWDVPFPEPMDIGTPKEMYEEAPNIETIHKKDPTLADHLHWQMNLTLDSDEDKFIGAVIIGNINNDGYLSIDLKEIAAICSAPEEAVCEILKVIQTFEPVGVAARTLKECLHIQARSLPDKNPLLEILIESYLDKLEERNYQKISAETKVSLDEIIATVKVLRDLNPKPGLLFSSEGIDYVVPDLVIVKREGKYDVMLNDDGIPQIQINPFYQNLLKKTKESKTKEFLGDKYRSALWLIKSIDQRRQTIYKVGKSIIKLQTEFMDKGHAYLKPMVLRDVARDIEMHESTVSRITTNKYMDTPQGIFELKFFFHSGIKTYMGNNNLSSIRVKNMIREVIDLENKKKPLTDDEMVEALMHKNAKIARRTITKYRKELNIPPASKRKKIY